MGAAEKYVFIPFFLFFKPALPHAAVRAAESNASLPAPNMPNIGEGRGPHVRQYCGSGSGHGVRPCTTSGHQTNFRRGWGVTMAQK